MTARKRTRLNELAGQNEARRRWSAAREHRPGPYEARWVLFYAGRVCLDCGSPRWLEYDHRDPATKRFNVSQGLHRPLVELKAEVAKCDLVCRPCHRRRTKERAEMDHVEPRQESPEQLEMAKVAFGGLVADLGAHDPHSDPDADADAAQRAE